MPNLQRAGVYTTENLTAIAPTISVGPSIMGFAGQHWRGPTTPYVCSSWNQFVQIFGGFNSSATPVLANPYLAYSVYEFFANGGQQAWIGRITSTASAGTTASTILNDLAATPQATLELYAGYLGDKTSVGTWGNDIYVDVVNRGGAGSGRFDLKIYNGGYGPAYLVETWIDLSMNSTDARYAVQLINSTIGGSMWVAAVDLNDSTASPNNAPAAITGRQFTGGTDSGDPSVSDRIVAVTSGTSVFDTFEGALTFNLPGETNASVLNAALTYTQDRPYGFCVMDPPLGDTVSSVVSFFQGLTPVVDAGALYYPWVVASDPSVLSSQATKVLPPGGFVMGQTAAIDSIIGSWQAPAGTRTALIGVVKTDGDRLRSTDYDTLNTNNVNALKTLANGQVVIMGSRTMKTGYSTMYIPIRRTLNYIEANLVQLLQPLVFKGNMPSTWYQAYMTVNHFLSGLYQKGAFFGTTPSTAFKVVCDGTNNTAQSVSAGIMNVDVYVALANPAEFIVINISLLPNGQSSVTTSI